MAIVPLFGGEDRLTVIADGADLLEGQLVRITGFVNNQLRATVADAAGEADGIMNVNVEDGELGACVQLVPGTVMRCRAGAGVTADTLVGPGAAGAVVAGATAADAIGRALTATDADGFALVLVK